ncbi:hypothetical protein NGM10_12510 [Halorussus salilacus]|uniref:hypothetical protein n=1 Tax=Halorussus salilacus TaxID=2953750 RepID=UPI00209F0B42|nr:hypothetical protein [Halorussus salilacus]USZ67546.1 hypothetical protein NGM10_12510 [Halorussus salilacus]
MTETGDTTPDASEEPTASSDSSVSSGPTGVTTDDFELRETLYKVALGLFGLLAVVAVVQLYASVGATINTFIDHEYRPLFRAAFNLVVLLTAGIGISWCVRELSGE